MRRESNAPTERIMRLLEDFQRFEDWADELEAKINENFPDMLDQIPPRPLFQSFIEERTRQSMNYKKTVGFRERMRSIRALAKDHGVEAQSTKGLARELGLEEPFDLDAIVDANERRSRDD